jgi:hypothetical protein
MNYSLVSKQNHDVWLAEIPDQSENFFSFREKIPTNDYHKNSDEAIYCLYRASMIKNIIKECSFFSYQYFKYRDLREKYLGIANMYVNVFGSKHSEAEIEKKWNELINYSEENYLQYFYVESTQKYFKFEMKKFINRK